MLMINSVRQSIFTVIGGDCQITGDIYGEIFPGIEKDLNVVEEEEEKEDEDGTGVVV